MCQVQSATCSQNVHKVQLQILTETAKGHHVRDLGQPIVVSSLGAIPEGTSDVRLIQDGSRQENKSLNNHATTGPVTYDTVGQETTLLSPGG